MFNQYRGLRKEMYVLFFARIMTHMGSIIMPMMSMILANKIGFTALQIAIVMMVYGLVAIVGIIVGGKLADRFNKRNIILLFDLITIMSFITAGMLPLGETAILLLFIGALFATMEKPSFDALVADFSKIEDRERSYSLSYLGANLGLVIAPIVGGYLFANYLNIAFIFNGLATLSSTILIFIFVKNTNKEISIEAEYENQSNDKTISVLKILGQSKTLIIFLLCSGLINFIFSQYYFLIPLNFEMLYGAVGAKYYGWVTCVNAVLVIVGMPLATQWFKSTLGVWKMVVGEVFIVISFIMYVFIQGLLPMCFVAMAIFTIGEIFSTLGEKPYMTERIPNTHRGRVSSVRLVVCEAMQIVGQVGIGFLIDTIEITHVWMVVSVIGCVLILLLTAVAILDKKAFPKLYYAK